ncbi:MAG: flagellar hook protein FlgE [Desulfohalobiaceae bacterium]|nr:flagellar hook protein FlgE [Desulfohalobiaceae bacterium]
MGLGGAMNSGISGLQSFSNAMSVIGNNLANTNTTGFKASRTLFADLIPDNVTGTGGTSQIGRGASLSKVDNIFTQGSIESTSSNTDLAIEGPGFFLVRNPDSQANNFTRAGTFRLDQDGYLTNPEGYVIQGYERQADGNFADLTGDIQINTRTAVPAQASAEVALTTNLDAQAETRTWVPEDPTGTSNFATTSEVYDSLGKTHLISTYFNKTDDNKWDFHQLVSLDDVANNGSGTPADTDNDGTDDVVEVGSGSFEFDAQGFLEKIAVDDGATITPTDAKWPTVETIPTGNLDWENGADTTQTMNYGMNITQYATDSKVVTQESDGYASGSLSDISVDTEGTITGTYSNGQTRDLARLALGKFSNNNGLAKVGKNLFAATKDSGPPDVGMAGSGVGKIYSNSLEQSTVDIAEEFTKMITTQRSFQANSKTITTTDEMLNEVINLKR